MRRVQVGRSRVLPWEIWQPADVLLTTGGVRRGGQKSAEAVVGVAYRLRTNAEPGALMEVELSRDNLMRAYQRVVRNKGAAGVDGLTVAALKDHLKSTVI